METIVTDITTAVGDATNIVTAIIALYVMYRGARFILKFFR